MARSMEQDKKQSSNRLKPQERSEVTVSQERVADFKFGRGNRGDGVFYLFLPGDRPFNMRVVFKVNEIVAKKFPVKIFRRPSLSAKCSSRRCPDHWLRLYKGLFFNIEDYPGIKSPAICPKNTTASTTTRLQQGRYIL